LAKRDGAWLDVERHDDLGLNPEVLVIRVESGLFFANSDHVRDRIESLRAASTRIVVLDAETSPFIDISAAEMLAQLAAHCAATVSSCGSPATSASSGT
jgi:MFS superfamily sulfate permease-like transporter